MRISQLEILRADGGWRAFSFLKLTTDESLVGWSEFLEGPWSPGLDHVILTLGQSLIGKDPRPYAKRAAELDAVTRFTAGGLSRQAVSALENACVDIAAKAAGVPAYALVGGPYRESVDVYWSHCGTFRIRDPELFERVIGQPQLESLESVRLLGEDAARRGFKAVKTNPIVFEAGGPRVLNPGFLAAGLTHEGTIDARTLGAIADQAAALRDGLGAERGLMMDFNFGFRPSALRRIARALAGTHPEWLEMDTNDPLALAAVRAETAVPVASLESLYGRRAYAPWLAAQAVDVAVVDVLWNGFTESLRIAALAESHEINVAPHNFSGPLADLISAHFCAAVPNVAIMEYEGDDVPWKHELVNGPSPLRDGRFTVPATPGWGADVNEAAVRAHPWPERRSADQAPLNR
jgi:galactonate dehydratase